MNKLWKRVLSRLLFYVLNTFAPRILRWTNYRQKCTPGKNSAFPAKAASDKDAGAYFGRETSPVKL